MTLTTRRWRVELRGNRLDITSLRQQLEGNPTVISEDGNAFYVSSPRLETATCARDVHSLAAQLVAELNGAAWLEWDNAIPVEVGGVYERGAGPGLWNAHVLVATVQGRSRAHAVGVAVTKTGPPANPPPPRLQQIVDAADGDDDVQDVLHYLGTEPTWYGLYKVCEIVISSSGGLAQPTSCSASEITLFRRTAQMFRHEGRRFTPPTNPMSLETASRLVRKLVGEWLETRVPRPIGNRDGP